MAQGRYKRDSVVQFCGWRGLSVTDLYPVRTDRWEDRQIDKTVICHFFYIMNLSHGFSSFPHNSVNAPESVSLKDNTNSFINKEYDYRNQDIFE